MTVIDVHNHMIPRWILEAAADESMFGLRYENGTLIHPEGFAYPVTSDYFDVGEKLNQLDSHGLDQAVISVAPTLFFYESEIDGQVAFARRVNDSLAELVSETERLAAIATLPLGAPEHAASELDRCVSQLGMKGAQIGTRGPAAASIADDSMAPVFEQAEQLQVPLMLHPSYVGPKAGLERYYYTNTVGNPYETTVAALDLIHSGVLDRYERLCILLVHGGGFLPYQIGRMDHGYAVRPEPRVNGIDRPSKYLSRFWFDSITHSAPSLHFLSSLVGPQRVLLGTDLGFDMADSDPRHTIKNAGLDIGAMERASRELFSL